MLKLSHLKVIIPLVASLTSLGLGAASPQSPKLLVGIMVEGLDGDYLELLREHFGDDGFRRLERNGLSIPQADYGTYLDAAAAAAEVMTGAAPPSTAFRQNIYTTARHAAASTSMPTPLPWAISPMPHTPPPPLR